ncbi:MAG: hypothetical protein P8K77_01035 [Polaribacter sp.]|nr:hypothetical protein [Polaribacter sp.]
MKDLKTLIKKPKFNVIFMPVGMLISMIISINVDVVPSANIGAILPYFYLPFITIIAIATYYFSRLFIKKFNWIISLICLMIN